MLPENFIFELESSVCLSYLFLPREKYQKGTIKTSLGFLLSLLLFLVSQESSFDERVVLTQKQVKHVFKWVCALGRQVPQLHWKLSAFDGEMS